MTVFQKQCLFGYLGYLPPNEQDGIAGAKTKAADAKFKADFGIEVESLGSVIAQAIANFATTTKTSDKSTGTFWATIRHFRREEFRCKCGGKYCNGYPAEMQEAVVRIADAAREHFGKPAHVVSGLRCRVWNAHEGGVANSQHMYGEAIDLRIEGVDSETLRQFVCKQPNHRYSYRINDTNVHFDIPAGKR